jgi:predicted nuclease with TOPRIM domain
MINLDEIEQLDKEIQEQTNLLKENTHGLESDIQQFKEISEVLGLIETENADLEKRLAASETKYAELQQQVAALEEVIQKRDNVMKILLKTVSDLNQSVTQIRNSLTSQAN